MQLGVPGEQHCDRGHCGDGEGRVGRTESQGGDKGEQRRQQRPHRQKAHSVLQVRGGAGDDARKVEPARERAERTAPVTREA